MNSHFNLNSINNRKCARFFLLCLMSLTWCYCWVYIFNCKGLNFWLGLNTISLIMHTSFIVHTDGHLGWFYMVAVTNNSVRTNSLQVSPWDADFKTLVVRLEEVYLDTKGILLLVLRFLFPTIHNSTRYHCFCWWWTWWLLCARMSVGLISIFLSKNGRYFP